MGRIPILIERIVLSHALSFNVRAIDRSQALMIFLAIATGLFYIRCLYYYSKHNRKAYFCLFMTMVSASIYFLHKDGLDFVLISGEPYGEECGDIGISCLYLTSLVCILISDAEQLIKGILGKSALYMKLRSRLQLVIWRFVMGIVYVAVCALLIKAVAYFYRMPLSSKEWFYASISSGIPLWIYCCLWMESYKAKKSDDGTQDTKHTYDWSFVKRLLEKMDLLVEDLSDDEDID